LLTGPLLANQGLFSFDGCLASSLHKLGDSDIDDIVDDIG